MKLRAAICGAVLLFAGVAHADTPPSIWDRAKETNVGDEFELHKVVQLRLLIPLPRGNDPAANARFRQVEDAQRRGVLAMLQSAGAETSKNPLLRFDLALTYHELGDHPRAVALFKSFLAEFPDHPMAEDAWLPLALSCGHIGDHVCEWRTYHRILDQQTNQKRRVTPTLNLAETDMHNGDLREAIDGYREVIRLAGQHSSSDISAPLGEWGLAVALDRAGEIAEAEKEARFAVDLARSIGEPDLLQDAEQVFFVPEYEVDWYLGLTAVARARVTTDRRHAVTLWQIAETEFTKWVAGGERTKDRWLPIAKVRLAAIKIERARAEVALAKEPPPKPEVHPEEHLILNF